jgi:hypothetical protein
VDDEYEFTGGPESNVDVSVAARSLSFNQDSTSYIFQIADFKRLVRGRDRGPESDFAAC